MIPQDKIDALIFKFERIEAAMSTATKADEIVRLFIFNEYSWVFERLFFSGAI